MCTFRSKLFGPLLLYHTMYLLDILKHGSFEEVVVSKSFSSYSEELIKHWFISYDDFSSYRTFKKLLKKIWTN